jgi:hypothetical protein
LPTTRRQSRATLVELVDAVGCHLVLTTGGTGPAARDVTPEATLAVADKVMPGFGEEMRRISLHFVADRHSLASSRGDSWAGADPQSAGATEVDLRNPGRSQGCRRHGAGEWHLRSSSLLPST